MSSCALAMITKKVNFAPQQWKLLNPSQLITINNGSGGPIAIFIHVEATDLMENPMNGINVNNCGKTAHVDAGSSVVCYTDNALYPVSFSSDNKIPGKVAFGTYQVEQQ